MCVLVIYNVCTWEPDVNFKCQYSSAIFLITWASVSLWSWRAAIWPDYWVREPQKNLLSLPHQCWDCKRVQPHPAFYAGELNSGPHDCTASTVPDEVFPGLLVGSHSAPSRGLFLAIASSEHWFGHSVNEKKINISRLAPSTGRPTVRMCWLLLLLIFIIYYCYSIFKEISLCAWVFCLRVSVHLMHTVSKEVRASIARNWISGHCEAPCASHMVFCSHMCSVHTWELNLSPLQGYPSLLTTYLSSPYCIIWI